MKKIIKIEDGRFDAMLGDKIAVFCGVYIYTGVLSGVNEDLIELKEAMIVYETGKLASGRWKDAQKLPSPWYVMRQGIESWGPAKC